MGPAAILEIFVNANTGKASADLKRFNGELKASESQASRSTGAVGKFGKAAKVVGVAAGAAAAYGIYKAVSAGSEFEKQMSSLGAVTEASARQMAKLEKQALGLGESTQYTANEVAKAQTELAKGGLSLKQIMGGGLKAALSLAAAGELELGDAASTTVNAMKLFGLRGRDATRVTDMLATAANRTTADVGDFAMALKQGGSVAKLAGLNLNETVTTLEALAEAGIKNSDAGTSLKSFFINIGTPSEKARKMMEGLGLSIFKQNGELKKLPAIAGNLRQAFGDITKEKFLEKAGTIAESDAIRTLYALYDAGLQKLRSLERANQKMGTAQDIARQKMDNLKGDWEQFTGALETGWIKLYKILKGPLRETTQWLTGAVQAVSNFNFGNAIKEAGEFAAKVHEMGHVEVAGLNFNAFDTYWAGLRKGAETYVAYLKALPGVATTAFGAVASAARWVVRASQDLAGWIAKAYRNVVGFVGSLIPVKVALSAVKLAIAPVVGLMGGLLKVIKILSPVIVAAANNFKSVWVAAMRVSLAIVQVLLKHIGNIGAVVGDVVGLVSNLLRGDWAGAWKNAKQLFVDVWHTIIDLLKGGWTVIKTLFSAGTKAMGQILRNSVGALGEVAGNIGEALKGAFSSAWDKIEGIFTTGANAVIDVINAIIDVINVIPGVPDIGKVGHLGGDDEGEKWQAKGSKKLHGQHRYTGGEITKPMAIVGEEAPRHHEWVIATNPAYKKANIGYWAQAGADLGVPGFAVGGLIGRAVGAVGKAAGVVGDVAGKGADYFVGKLPNPDLPEPFAELGSYLVSHVTDYIMSGFKDEKLGRLVGSAVGKGVLSPDQFIQVAREALQITGHGRIRGGAKTLLWLAQKESGLNPNAINLTDINAKKGIPSQGLMQVIPPTFSAYHEPGTSSNIKDPLANIAASINYQFDRYGRLVHFTPYAKGGLIGNGLRAMGPKVSPAHLMRAGGGMTDPSWDAGSELIASSIAQLVAAYAKRFDVDITAGYDPEGGHVSPGHNVTGTATDVVPRDGNWDGAFAKGLETLAKFGFEVGYDGSVPGTENWPDHGRGNHAHIEWVGNGTASDARERLRSFLESGGTALPGGGLNEGQQTAAEGKARKKAREAQLKKLRAAVTGAKTDPAKQSKLWQLVKFWGRTGMFDKDERARVLDYVQQAASKAKVGDSVRILQNLAAYAGEHGEITGKDPDNWHSLIDAMNKAQEKGKDHREKAIERQKKKREARRNKKLAKVAERAEMPDLVARLDAFRTAADVHDEVAGQLVTLEPENLDDAYVNQERSAYQASLNELRDWRNAVVGGRELATLRIAQFQEQIARIEEMAPKADVKGSKKGLGLAAGQAFGKNSYAQEKWKLPGLKQAIETTTSLRDETLLGELEELSPLALDGIIAEIPSSPEAGKFGGRIFDTQNTIRELGIKVGSSGGADLSERVSLLEEQLLRANQRNLVFDRQKPIIDAYEAKAKFAGMFAKGGSIPAGMWGIAGEAGPEPIMGPATVVSNSDSQEMFGGSPKVLVQVFEGDASKTKIYVDDKQVEAIVRKGNRREGRGAQSVGARSAGRGIV